MNEKGKKGEGGRVVLAASRHFVFQSFEPVEGILPNEAEEAAVLAFEEELPFPGEQVAIGVYSDVAGRVAVWGCDRSVLPECGGDEFLLPEFFPLLGWSRKNGTIEYLETVEGGCLLFFETGGVIPSEVIGLQSAPDSPEFRSEVESSFEFLGRKFLGIDSLTKVSIQKVSADSRDRFVAVVLYPDGEERSWSVADDSLWKADLRPTEEIQKFRTDKKSAERIWVGARIAAAFILFLIVGQGLLWGLDYWVDGKESTQRQLAPRVRSVEERADLAARLNDLGESRVSVFERLGDLNLVRPDGIQFLDVTFDEPDTFRVEGRVTNVRVLNEFVERLKSDERFSLTDAPPPRTRDGRVEFELSVRVPNQGGGQG